MTYKGEHFIIGNNFRERLTYYIRRIADPFNIFQEYLEQKDVPDSNESTVVV